MEIEVGMTVVPMSKAVRSAIMAKRGYVKRFNSLSVVVEGESGNLTYWGRKSFW